MTFLLVQDSEKEKKSAKKELKLKIKIEGAKNNSTSDKAAPGQSGLEKTKKKKKSKAAAVLGDDSIFKEAENAPRLTFNPANKDVEERLGAEVKEEGSSAPDSKDSVIVSGEMAADADRNSKEQKEKALSKLEGPMAEDTAKRKHRKVSLWHASCHCLLHSFSPNSVKTQFIFLRLFTLISFRLLVFNVLFILHTLTSLLSKHSSGGRVVRVPALDTVV